MATAIFAKSLDLEHVKFALNAWPSTSKEQHPVVLEGWVLELISLSNKLVLFFVCCYEFIVYQSSFKKKL